MRWTELLPHITTIASHAADIDVRSVHYDSRRVNAGDVFVAMRGDTTDGNRFIDAAIQRGAAAVVTDSPEMYGELRARQPELALALVDRGRRALAEASAEIFGHPESKLKISAVTGTNGKTTTAFLLEQMLAGVGRKCILIGTIGTRIAGDARPSEHTTPESRDLYALFAEGVAAGCTEVVMEISSHALEQERVWGIPVDVAIFTNLTQDHLDFHGTMDNYAAAKARLFTGEGAAPPRVAVIESSGPYSRMMIDAVRPSTKLVTYQAGAPLSHFGNEQWVAERIDHSGTGTSFKLRKPAGDFAVRSPLTGSVNILNLLAAMVAATSRGLTMQESVEAASRVTAVPGRFQSVPNATGITVIVDYAHTDDALRNLLSIARDVCAGGKVITMFGCGGDRDRGKRRKMGHVAGADSDLVIVTSDNPRSEDPMSIINEIVLGVRETNSTYVVEEDRKAAIGVAIRSAKLGDTVLLAGKGHEKVQIFADGALPFDDVAVAATVLQQIEREGLK